MSRLRMAIVLSALALPALAQTSDPTGTWLTESGATKVRIAPCGSALCGTILSSSAQQKDVHNPDPAKKDRNLVGVQMISNIKPNGDAFSGELYNFQDGKTYTGKLKLKSATAMEMSGCVLGGLICRSQTWTRTN